MNQNSDELGQQNRRNYLKNIGLSSVGLVGLSTYPVAAGGGATEIITLRNRDGPVETESVPTEWWETEIDARQAREELLDQVAGNENIATVGLSNSDRTIDGRYVKHIQVGVKGSKTNANLPNQINGVPIQIVEHEKTEWQCYTNDYDPVEGGVAIQTNYAEASACCAVYNSGTYLMSARHIFNSQVNGCVTGNPEIGEPANQYTDYFGDVVDSYAEHDTAFIEPMSDESVSNAIVNESAPIKGWVTQNGLASYSSNGTPIKGRFKRSCTATGTIDSYDNFVVCSNGRHTTEVVEMDAAYTQLGDSGGIWYRVNPNGNAFVANIQSGLLVDNHSSGSAAYAIRNFSGYTFGL